MAARLRDRVADSDLTFMAGYQRHLSPGFVAAYDRFHDEGLIDQTASLSVRFENGATATFSDSAVAPVTREHIHIWDDEGAVYLEGKGWGERTLTVVESDGGEQRPDFDPEDAQSKFGAFADAIATGGKPPATAQDVLVVTALLDAAYESARTGERVSIDWECVVGASDHHRPVGRSVPNWWCLLQE